MPTPVGESGFGSGHRGFAVSPVHTEPVNQTRLQPATCSEAAPAASPGHLRAPLGGWWDRPAAQRHPTGGSGWDNMAVARPFVPCYQKELKAETAFSQREAFGPPAIARLLIYEPNVGGETVRILIYTFGGVSKSSY